jgi:hypothetical protein
LKIHDFQFGACMQSTYGVGLKDLSKAIDALHPGDEARQIEAQTRRVDQAFAQHHGSARGVVKLICSYLQQAEGGSVKGPANAYFTMMARSDFCSIYDHLLEPHEQEAIRSLVLGQEAEGSLPPLMSALGMAEDDRVFRKPYLARGDSGVESRMERGPTVKDWLESMVKGCNAGTFRKDLLSPPPGFPVHSDDAPGEGMALKPHGMGRMGVDKANGLVIFEIRANPRRLDSVPMNSQLRRSILREYQEARRFNATLPGLGSRVSDEASNHAILRWAGNAFMRAKKLNNMFARGQPVDLNDPLQNSRRNLVWRDLEKMIEAMRGEPKKTPALQGGGRLPSQGDLLLKRAMELQARISTLGEGRDDAEAERLALNTAIDAFGKLLWTA